MYFHMLSLPHKLHSPNSVCKIQFQFKILDKLSSESYDQFRCFFSSIVSSICTMRVTEPQCINRLVALAHLCWLLEDKKYFHYCCASST